MRRGALLPCLTLSACAASLPDAPLLQPLPSPAQFSLQAPREDAEDEPPELSGLEALSVEQAVVLALTHNRDLEAQTLAPIVAGTFARIERGRYDPELFAELTYFNERASQTARATGEQFDVSGESSNAQVGLRQALPTGTTLEASVGHQLDVSSRTPAQNEARLDLSVTQSLLRGLGPSVHLAALRQTDVETEASVHELRAYAESFVARVEEAYWALSLAAEEVRIYERSKALAEQEAADVEARVEVGTLAQIDLAAARAEVAVREQGRIDAVSLERDARLRLLQLLGARPQGLERPVTPTSPVQTEMRPLEELDARCQLAAENRADLLEAKARQRASRLQVVVTRDGILPRLDAFVALGKTGFARDALDAFSSLDGPTYDVQAGLSLGYFLGHRGAEAADLAARATSRQARLAVENLSALVQLEVRLAANELARARAQIDAGRVTRDYREAAVQAEEERLSAGSGTVLLVARAQRDLLESEIALARARVAYRNALTHLYLAEGTLLARRGMTVATPR